MVGEQCQREEGRGEAGGDKVMDRGGEGDGERKRDNGKGSVDG